MLQNHGLPTRLNQVCLLTNEELNSIFQKSISAEKKKNDKRKGKTYILHIYAPDIYQSKFQQGRKNIIIDMKE